MSTPCNGLPARACLDPHDVQRIRIARRSCSFYRLYVVTPEDTEDFEHEFPAIPTTYYEWIRPEFRATVLARPRTPDDLRRPRINQGTERVFAQVCA